MIDLLEHSVRVGEHGGREFIEIPSQSFVAKCLETKAAYKAAGSHEPLPPD